MAVDGTQQDFAAAVLSAPLHQLLGLRLIDAGDPAAGVEFDVEGPAVNPSGVLHGSVTPLAMDVACFLAVTAELEPGSTAVTVSIASSLLAAVPAGATVQARGRVDRRGRTLAHLSATVTHGDRTVATAQVVKALAPPR